MSQLKQLGAMTRLNIRLQLTDPAPTLILTVIPLVLIPFMMPAFKSMLLADGYTGVTGAEQAVPSIAILFSFLAVQNIISSFFNEQSWGTWQRPEVSPTSRASILTGKALVAFLMQTAQIAVVLALGALIFGYRPTGSLVALALWSHSRDAALSLSNIVGMLAAGIGGSFSTISSFPDWAQHAARLSPAYWAITAIHEVSLDGANLSDVGMRIGVLWGFFAVIAGLALIQFRYHRE